MALSSKAKNILVDTVNEAFKSIGKTFAGTKLPRNMSNTASLIAYEYWTAGHLASYANKRKEAAEAAMVKAGFIPDKEKNPQPPGRQQVYSDEAVAVTLEVRNPSERIDGKKIVEYLAAAGVDTKLLDEALRLYSKTMKSAHVFTAYLVTGEGNGK